VSVAAGIPAAYGFRFAGLPVTPWLGAHGAELWPVLTIERRGRARELDPVALCASAPAEAELGELIHPILSGLAAEAALARGYDGLHAGGVCGRDGVWVLTGAREAGKSTLLAACTHAGVEVFTDDVLVFDGGRCFAGPRCLDLRADVGWAYARAQPVRPTTPRLRLTLPVIAAERPLAGFVHLAWGPKPELRHLAVSEALRRLACCYASGGFTSRRERLLDLAGLPSFELRRPRNLAALGLTVALLRDRLLG